MNKLHLCSGTVYLKDYINCDYDGKLVSECTIEELEINKTTIDKYFKYPFEPDSSKRIRREFIVDRKFNILEAWPWAESSASQIILVNAVEHFTRYEIKHIVSEIDRVLCNEGTLLVSFPDIFNTVISYWNKPDEMAELIYCNWKDNFSIHKWCYTAESFAKLFNYKYVWQRVNIINTDYPSIELTGTKYV